MDTYGGCCGSCVHLNVNDYVRSKDNCLCTLRGGYHNLHERSCYKYDYDKYRDYYELNRRWYIVGAICQKLGLSDQYECVSLLHNFRVDVLEKDAKYDDILKEYDMVGPFLAQMLETDDDSKELCERLLQVYLVKVLDLIQDKKNDEALQRYLEMVNLLRTIYHIDGLKTQNKTAMIKTM